MYLILLNIRFYWGRVLDFDVDTLWTHPTVPGCIGLQFFAQCAMPWCFTRPALGLP